MKIAHIFNHQVQIRSLAQKEFNLAKKILLHNLCWQKNDRILIVTDLQMLKKEAVIWFETAKQLTDKVQMLVLSGLTHSGQEPPAEVVKACQKADISILHTQFSLSHTQAGQAIKKYHHRGASLPGVNYQLMMKTFDLDYQQMKNLGDKIQFKLKQADSITISSAAGTQISAKIRKKHIFNDSGLVRKGEFCNLPAGEVFFAPLEGTTQGIFIINAAIADFNLASCKPNSILIKVTIKDGYACQFENLSPASSPDLAKQLPAKLKKIGPQAFNIAEIGLGTNQKTNPYGQIIEAEKAYGTVHLAFGNNFVIGGKIKVPIHLDALTMQPTVIVDQKVILKNGYYLVN